MPPEATIPELDAQYRAIREGAGSLDRSDRGKLIVRGPDAVDFLQGQLTNDLERLSVGEGCYAALLDRKAHVLADARVLLLEHASTSDDGSHASTSDDGSPASTSNDGSPASTSNDGSPASTSNDGSPAVWLDTEAVALESLRKHLATYKVGRDLEVEDVTEGRAILSLLGPAATEIAGAGPLSPEHSHRPVQLEDLDCIAVATADGVDLICDSDAVEQIADRLLEAGAVPVSEAAAEIVRVESGLPRYGREITSETMPAEAGIVERAVDFEKGCYIGQEPVARLHYRGKPNRRLCSLRLSGPGEDGARLLLGERDVGAIATAVVSPRAGPIALAILRREAEPGSTLTVGEDGVTAEIVEP